MGAGATRRFSAVRWGVARRIVWAWIFTIPASGILAALAALALRSGSLSLVLAIVVLVASFAWLAQRDRRLRHRPLRLEGF
jgi:inorganic phosphate transporter, PiT family